MNSLQPEPDPQPEPFLHPQPALPPEPDLHREPDPLPEPDVQPEPDLQLEPDPQHEEGHSSLNAAARVTASARARTAKMSQTALSLGEYLRDQRRSAQMTLRQLADQAGVSNPYLSQIERGLRKPSTDVLQQLAKALRISAETLYVRAGILDPADSGELSVQRAVLADPALSERQRQVLLDIYGSFRREGEMSTSDEPMSTSDESTSSQSDEPITSESIDSAEIPDVQHLDDVHN